MSCAMKSIIVGIISLLISAGILFFIALHFGAMGVPEYNATGTARALWLGGCYLFMGIGVGFLAYGIDRIKNGKDK